MKPPVLAIAIGKPKGMHDEPDGDESHEESADASDSDERDAFDAFVAAMRSKDDDTAYEALRSMIETCAAKIKEGSYGPGEEG